MQLFFKQNINLSNRCLRCIDILSSIIAVGTLDKKVLILDADTKQIKTQFDFFEKAIYSVKIFQQENIEVAIGSADGNVYIMTLDGDIKMILEGHQGIVNSLSIRNGLLASGAWDGQCKIWDLKTYKNIATLSDHKYAVSVCFAFGDKLVTGSQDGIAKLWDKNFSMIKKLKVHDDIIRNIVNHGQNEVLTCSNDLKVKILDQNFELQICESNHKSFVYAINSYDGKFFLSGGEDFMIKLYNDCKEVQSFSMSSIVWGIVSSVDLKEIYCVCESGDLIVLSTSKENVDLKQHDQYVENAKIACLGNPDFSEEQKKNFSKVEDMHMIKGKKEGEVKVFMNGGKGEAYCWQQGKWNLIGEVLGNNNSSYYEGDEFFPKGNYDFIFNIESEEGQKRLLPFNKNDNALLAAEKFLAKEQLSVGYKEQIVNFINKNANLDKSQIQRESQQDSQMEIEPQQVKQNVLKNFPIVDYIFYSKFNSEKFIEKLKEINDMYKEKNSDKKLNLTEFVYVENVAKKLENFSQMNLNDIKDTEILALQKLLKWNDENSYLVMDLFRMFCMHRDSQQLLNNVDYGAKFIIFAGACLRNKGQKYTTLTVYFLNNLFKTNPLAFIKNQDIILDIFELKQKEFSLQDQSKILTLFNQYLSYHFQHNQINDISKFYNIIKNFNLKELLQKQNEVPNYILALGNCISFENEAVINHLKTPQMKELIRSLICKPPNDILLKEIQTYVEKL